MTRYNEEDSSFRYNGNNNTASSNTLYSDAGFSYDNSDSLELDELRGNGKAQNSSSNSQFSLSDESPDIYEDDWSLLNRRQKFNRFWYRVWHGPLYPKDLPPQFSNRHLQLLDALPKRLKSTIALKFQILIMVGFFSVWFLTMHLLLTPSLTRPPTYTYTDDTGNKTTVDIISLSCNDERSFWKGKNAECGFDAKECKPFENREVIFRCPALCDRGSWTYSSMPIGNQSIKYRGYFVGGGLLPEKDGDRLTYPYRSDSFPCGAATHAGLISPVFGGCAKVSYVGSQTSFPAKKGYYGVDDSIEFDSFFPSSYVFEDIKGKTSNCYDPRIVVVVLNLLFGLPVMYFCNGFVAFWIITTSGFWTICLLLDPPIIINALDPESLSTLLSLGLERFLPSLFILYTLWHFAVRNTLSDPEDPRIPGSPISKLLLWYPLFWLGVLNNVTFDRLPVDRLNMDDIRQQAGSLTAILGIVITITVCAVIQAYRIWLTGKFRTYLYVYLSFIGGLFLLSQVHGLTLRVHHYILAMLLIPGTGTKGLSAMLFQGLLIGLFLSGASRWGLASIAETSRALRRQDPSGEIKPPAFIGFDNDTKIVSWKNEEKHLSNVVDGEILHPSDILQGYSLLINDVERYKGNLTSINIEQLILENAELQKMVNTSLETSKEINLYMRLSRASLKTQKHSDFTNAAILKWPSGEFIKPKPGIT